MTSTIGFTRGARRHLLASGIRVEGTLSIHTIVTARREAFYWLAILFTFALGTAAGDLVAEKFGLGYLATGMLVRLDHRRRSSIGYFWLGLDGILAFWLVYIFTRPLGASFGDLLSQPADYGGLGFGTIVTSLIFLGVIVAVVGWMTITREEAEHEAEDLPDNLDQARSAGFADGGSMVVARRLCYRPKIEPGRELSCASC